MPGIEMPKELDARVAELTACFGSHTACAADLLCDRHDPAGTAFTFIRPDLTATSLTFGSLSERSKRLAGSLTQLGVAPGARVATLMGKSEEYVVTLMAIWRVGAVHVPLFTAFGTPAIIMRLQASGCTAIVCDEDQQSKLKSDASDGAPPWTTIVHGRPATDDRLSWQQLYENAPAGPTGTATAGGNDPIIQIYTSGTTGTPKGVVVPLSAVSAFQAYAEFGLGLAPGDVFWNAADPGWAYGLYFGVLATLSTGVAGLLFQGGFSAPQTLRILSEFKVTNFAAAPTVYRALKAADTPVGARDFHICRASSAGEPLTPDVNEWARSALGVEVYDHYGQTETGMVINNHHHPRLRRPLRSGSMGRPMPGWQAVILDGAADEPAVPGTIGRVALDLEHSPLAWFTGYVGDNDHDTSKFTANKRWYVTGDTGSVDAEGYFYFGGRDDDIIIMAGYRIGPGAIEAILLDHDAVRDSAVIATPDAVRGEVLEAVIVLAEGYEASESLVQTLQAKVREEYGSHAYPRRVHFIDEMPRTPSGKIQRFLLRQRFAPEGSGHVQQAG